jgi:hypothetical protein
MKTTRLDPHSCPVCQTNLDAASDPTVENNVPSPGDITLCFYCESLCEFDRDMKLKQVELEELQPEVQDAIEIAIAQIQAAKQRNYH